MSLDTLANVKTRLGISSNADDALLVLLMNSADKWIGNYCGRDFGGGTYTEYHPGGSEFIHLKNFPVQSVTSVKVDPAHVFGADTVISASSYVVHSERGVIQSLVGPFVPREEQQGLVSAHVADWTRGPRIIQVVYTVAAEAVADDIREAHSQLIDHWFRRCKTQMGLGFVNLTGQKVGGYEVSYRSDQIGGLPIPPDIFALLAPHRVPSV
jgi:hypothetical protein